MIVADNMTLSDLPEVILMLITDFLSTRETLLLRALSRQWFSIIPSIFSSIRLIVGYNRFCHLFPL